jgi:hypothetical protein
MTRTPTRYTNGRYRPKSWWLRKDARNWMTVVLIVLSLVMGGIPHV